ncbi:MAG: hypothetical protein A2Y00_03250 [Omnitrophica WOR_2 bacterium GWF2_43_52]|nr:MAG: hypothetical protein A2Y06_01810 [Omnitrophica WOR_2 bacterium GWA2_37_7]OGX22452.1 MAG: hypothetical protein A2Y00_03250 [Omnitrophica WOR_2 bacterium GWF2_43_52]OGX58940.1 MAG: hypothetical protein A2460_07810 [Omnitrophica WOR_2 bacterium RIFOXYC2_FULL_43_9]
MKKKVLLCVLPYYDEIFSNALVKVAVSRKTMMLGIASVAGELRKNGFVCRIIDLNLTVDPESALKNTLQEFLPDYAGMTITTPLVSLGKKYSKLIKDTMPSCITVAGGPHASVLPEELLKQSHFDIAVKGEGELTMRELVSGAPLEKITGISFKAGNTIASNPPRPLITDLDTLADPAYELYDIKKYVHPKMVARRNPVAALETSRGCFGKCSYCNKSIFDTKYRMKSPQRVVQDFIHVISLGFREIHIVDDVFSGDMARAKNICKLLLSRKLDITWYPRGGLRVDRVDKELIYLMRQAGCYRIPFGIESGSQKILDTIGKGITLAQVRKAVDLAKAQGMEVEGYFMLGLPNDTLETLKETLDFALSLNIDYAKFAITVPLPGTLLFKEWDAAGIIKTKDWNKYNFASSPRDLYEHPGLNWKDIDYYYRHAHRSFYLRPSFVMRRFRNSFKNGALIEDIKSMLQVKWF